MKSISNITVSTDCRNLPGPTAPQKGRVYAVDFGRGVVKIGLTQNLLNRVRSLQVEHRRFNLAAEFSAAAFTDECFNAAEMEKALLAMFERSGGEYVKASFKDVADAMRTLDCRTEPNDEDIKGKKRSEAFIKEIINFIAPPPRDPQINQSNPIETNNKLDMVNECCDLFGPEVAGWLFMKLGFPMPPAHLLPDYGWVRDLVKKGNFQTLN